MRTLPPGKAIARHFNGWTRGEGWVEWLGRGARAADLIRQVVEMQSAVSGWVLLGVARVAGRELTLDAKSFSTGCDDDWGVSGGRGELKHRRLPPSLMLRGDRTLSMQGTQDLSTVLETDTRRTVINTLSNDPLLGT